jgi:hypothetical protein
MNGFCIHEWKSYSEWVLHSDFLRGHSQERGMEEGGGTPNVLARRHACPSKPDRLDKNPLAELSTLCQGVTIGSAPPPWRWLSQKVDMKTHSGMQNPFMNGPTHS